MKRRQEERQRTTKGQKGEDDSLETDGPNVQEDVQMRDRGHSVPEAKEKTAENRSGARQKTVIHIACLTCSYPINDLEDDGIRTRCIKERTLCQRPKEILSDYADTKTGKRRRTMFCMCGSEQKPKNCLTTRIYIVHKYADKREGDLFGAYLRTYTDELEDGSLYNKHFLQKIQDNSPAWKMCFRDNDEIGLFNEIFAPHLDHKELLKKFREVKVDGKTRFSLIIRRTKTRYKAKRPEWIKISAIFVPEKPKEHEPVVIGQEERPLGDNGYDIVTKILLRIPGSQQFLELKDNTVSADVLDGMYDKSKDLSKRTHYKLDDADHITYYSSLCDVENKRFVSVDRSNNVIVDMTGYFFRWTREGGEVQFELNSEDRYLAFQNDRKIAIVQSEKFRFEEFPAEEYYIRKALFEQQCVNSRYTGDEATSVCHQTARDSCVLGCAELSVTPDPSVYPPGIPASTTKEINPERRDIEDISVPSDLNKGISTECADKSKKCLLEKSVEQRVRILTPEEKFAEQRVMISTPEGMSPQQLPRISTLKEKSAEQRARISTPEDIAKGLSTHYRKENEKCGSLPRVLFQSYEKEAGKYDGVHMKSIQDLFCDNDKEFTHVVLCSADNLEKTNLCQYIISCWCEVHSPLERTPELFPEKDREYMKTFDYVFQILESELNLCVSIKKPLEMIYKWLSEKFQFALAKNELSDILRKAKFLIFFQGHDFLSDFCHDSLCTFQRRFHQSYFFRTSGLPQTQEQLCSQTFSARSLQKQFLLTFDKQSSTNHIYCYLERSRSFGAVTFQSLRIDGINNENEMIIGYLQINVLNILKLCKFDQISVHYLQLIHNDISGFLDTIKRNIQLKVITLSNITCLNHMNKCSGLKLDLIGNSDLLSIDVTSTQIEYLLCSLTNKNQLRATPSSLKGLHLDFGNKNHIFSIELLSSLPHVLVHSPLLLSVTLSHMKLGGKQMPQIEINRKVIQEITESEEEQHFASICTRMIGRQIQGKDIAFDADGFKRERNTTKSFADSIILNLVAYALTREHHEEVVYTIPTVCVGFETPKLVCIVKAETCLRSYRGFPVQTRQMDNMSKASVMAENSIDRNSEKYESVVRNNIVDINKVLDHNSTSLFSRHSNIEAIRVSFVKEKQSGSLLYFPCVVIYCKVKGAVPYKEELFPQQLHHPSKQVSYPTDIREGYFSFCPYFSLGSRDWNKELAMGCSIGEMNVGNAGTLGSFVNVVDTNETCFLTVRHVFPPYSRADNQIIGAKVVQPADSHLPPTPQAHGPDRECGEVIACVLNDETDAALVAIKENRKPGRGHFVTVTQEELLNAGLSPTQIPSFDDGKMMDVTGLTLRDNATRPILKIGARTGLTKGFLTTTNGVVKESGEFSSLETTYNGRKEAHLIKGQLFIDSLCRQVFCQGGDSGAAVFLLDSDLHLHCIGMVVGMLTDCTAVVTPIKKVLQTLGQQYGQRSLELKRFDFEQMDS